MDKPATSSHPIPEQANLEARGEKGGEGRGRRTGGWDTMEHNGGRGQKGQLGSVVALGGRWRGEGVPMKPEI